MINVSTFVTLFFKVADNSFQPFSKSYLYTNEYMEDHIIELQRKI